MASLDKIYLPQLRGLENYVIQSIRVKTVLIKEDLYAPIETLSIGPKNNKAISILKLYCDNRLLLYLKDIESAYEAWLYLEALYNPKGFTTKYLTLKDFFNTILNEFHLMEEYLNRVKTLVDDLKGKGIKLPNQVIIAQVLNSLNDNYNRFIQNII